MEKLGLIGLGAFGRIAAKHLCAYFDVHAFDIDPAARRFAARYNLRLTSLKTAAGAKYVILAVPVPALEPVAEEIAPHLQPGSVILDVGSVKMRPAAILQRTIPEHVDIICTHPLFGPQSTSGGLQGRKIVLCPVRCSRTKRICQFLEKVLELDVHLTSPEAHDRDMAAVQGLTHMIARVFANVGQIHSQHTTMSFDHLIKAVDLVRNDSEELFLAIQRDNPYAKVMRDRFFDGVELLKSRLDRGDRTLSGEVLPLRKNA